MMRQVLKDHPNSGKAHFVEAELLAKQGDFAKAREELANAERLAPGLPFAKPQAVENLKSLLRGGHAAPATPVSAGADTGAATIPWGLILGGLGLAAFVTWAVRLMARRTAPIPAPAGGVPAGYGPPPAGYGAPAPAETGNGLGSRIMGGLAAGAAVGAGVVAGEAIARHFLHDDETPARRAGADLAPSTDSVFNDLGGGDFGIADGNSWDDGGAGDSDWS